MGIHPAKYALKMEIKMEKIRIGIFGLGRGANFFEDVKRNGGVVAAICDRDPKKIESALEHLPSDVATYSDFDEFIEHDLDAILLANCFHEHARFAIKCLEKNINVLSECISNVTMAEGVALARAQEKSKATYMLYENYPFMLFSQEMRQVYRGGTLGEAGYCEGEYNHPFDWDSEFINNLLRPYPNHWRNYMPATYYITHALAPLMHMTGAFPKRVSAMPVYKPFNEFKCDGTMVGDRSAIITCLNDDDSVFRVTGWSQLGGHSISYRLCGTKGQIENLRGKENGMLLSYNDFNIPEGAEQVKEYTAQWPDEYKDIIADAGHGGSDHFVIKEFFDALREGRKPAFDVHFATTCSSVAILGYRSMAELGTPYDIPDFRREEDRVKYENDTATPFWGTDGTPPTMPCCSRPDYKPNEEKYQNYLDILNK